MINSSIEIDVNIFALKFEFKLFENVEKSLTEKNNY